MIIRITCSKCGHVFTAQSETSVEDAKMEYAAWGGWYREAISNDVQFVEAKAVCAFCWGSPTLFGPMSRPEAKN